MATRTSNPRRAEASLLPVRVSPRSSTSAVEGWRDGALRVRVTAAPTDGRANRAVAALLAETFGVAPSAVRLVSGAAARDKLFRVGALGLDELRARVGEARA